MLWELKLNWFARDAVLRPLKMFIDWLKIGHDLSFIELVTKNLNVLCDAY